MKVPRWLDRLLFEPASPLSLIAARVILGLHALWLVLSRFALPELAAWPDTVWRDLHSRVRFGIVRFSSAPAFETVLYWLLIVALVAVVLNVATRAACLISALLLYHFAPFEGVAGGIPYTTVLGGLTIPLLGLLILGFATIPQRRAEWSPEHRWPLTLILSIVAWHYVSSGLAKTHWAGTYWYTTENVGNLAGVLATFESLPWAMHIHRSPALATALGVATFLLEFGFPLVLVSKWARRIWIPAAIAAFLIRIPVFGFFYSSWPVLLLFLNWDWVDRKRRPAEVPREVELNVLAARTEMSATASARIRELAASGIDWRHVLEYAQFHGTLQFLAATLQKLGIQPDETHRHLLSTLAERNSTRAFFQHREMRRIAAGLAERGISAYPYKGSVLSSQLYGRVNMRIAADIDFLVDAADVRRAIGAMRELGYESAVFHEVDIDSILARGKEIDLVHRRMHITVEVQWRAFPRNMPCGFVTDTKQYRFAPLASDSSITTLVPEDLFLVLIHHGLGHRWELLKWILDIDGMLRSAEIDWQKLADRAKGQGSWRAVQLATSTAAALFETPVPGPVIATDPAVDGLRSEVIRLLTVPRARLFPLEDFWFQLAARERWIDRLRYLRFVCSPKPRDLEGRRFLGLPMFVQPFLRPLRLLVEMRHRHEHPVSDAQRIAELER